MRRNLFVAVFLTILPAGIVQASPRAKNLNARIVKALADETSKTGAQYKIFSIKPTKVPEVWATTFGSRVKLRLCVSGCAAGAKANFIESQLVAKVEVAIKGKLAGRNLIEAIKVRLIEVTPQPTFAAGKTATPENTVSPNRTASRTATRTAAATANKTVLPTSTPSAVPTFTPTLFATFTNQFTATVTRTSTITRTPSNTNTRTNTPTNTPTNTRTSTPTFPGGGPEPEVFNAPPADLDTSTLQAVAKVDSNLSQITFQWLPQTTTQFPFANADPAYKVYRREQNETNWTDRFPSGIIYDSSFTDSATKGVKYEYQLRKYPLSSPSWLSTKYAAASYLYSGIEIPLVEQRGIVILVVESFAAAALSAELAVLKQDLVGDGWTVIRHDVSSAASPSSIRNLIIQDYNTNPTAVRSLFLFGRVPEVLSGNYAPDGHHNRPWPTNSYYGDVNGTWSDANSDGIFDAVYLPSPVELEVGRVDLSNLPVFQSTNGEAEIDLLRKYLSKDHRYRHKELVAEYKGYVSDSFGSFGGEAFAASGWRDFAPLLGGNKVNAPTSSYFQDTNTNSYIWGYGCGPGNYEGAGGIGSSSNFAANDSRVIFQMLFGSYFGEWNSANNFMRSSLATSYGLTVAWSGRPWWAFHHLGLGEVIGKSAKINQNASYSDYVANGAGSSGIHVGLLGDPTLRMYVMDPPHNFSASRNGGSVTLSWIDSQDAELGYHVYRSTSQNGPFTRITSGSSILQPNYTDNPGAGTFTYMVKAIKLETTKSGSFYNSSQGAFITVN